jgi:ribose 5-phosphate isomerase B
MKIYLATDHAGFSLKEKLKAHLTEKGYYKGVRCGLFYAKAVPVGPADVAGRVSSDPFEIIRLSREHNNANMLSLSARFLTEEDAIQAADLWLTTDFTNDPRHVRRIEKFTQLGE